MDNEKIAKNLLENKVCKNCVWVINDKYYYNYNSMSCLKFPHIPEENTCEFWESMKDAVRSIS